MKIRRMGGEKSEGTKEREGKDVTVLERVWAGRVGATCVSV